MTMPLQPARHLVLLLAAALLVCCCFSTSADDFTYGRGTFYDDNQQGSCHYGSNIPQWYGAWPDTQAGFSSSCGSCWDVSCVDDDFKDGYGSTMQRSNACYDTRKSVVIKIVDSCPCVHQNFYSNQRWCCGDMNHLDLGRQVFEQLADIKWGVIGLRWKKASCDQLGPRTSHTQTQPSSSNNQGSSNSQHSSSSSQKWQGWSWPRSSRSFGDVFARGWMGQGW